MQLREVGLTTHTLRVDDVGIVVSDEFHLLHDPSRGPTLEVLLSRIRQNSGCADNRFICNCRECT